jgi:invasion protein IalB
MHRTIALLPVATLALLALAASYAVAAPLSAADRAWIAKCVSDRKATDVSTAALQRYCACMQEIVDDNRPFESITALERTHPPAHRHCLRRR